MEMMLNKIVPEGLEYRHSCEGPDDMVNSEFLKIFCSKECFAFYCSLYTIKNKVLYIYFQ